MRHRFHVALTQRAVAAHAHRVVIFHNRHTHLHQLRRDGFQVLRRHVFHKHIAARCSRSRHVRAGFNLIRNNRIRNALQMLHAANLDNVRTGAANVRTHGV